MGAGQAKVIQESVAQLQQANISPANEEFWKRFYSAAVTPYDLLLHVPTKELIKIRQNNTRNFAVLIVQLISRLRRNLTGKNAPSDLSEGMNAVRLLTRLLPVAFQGSINDGFEETLFWKNTLPGSHSVVSPPPQEVDVSATSPANVEDPIIPSESQEAPSASDQASEGQKAPTSDPSESPFSKSFDSVLKNTRPIARQLLDSLISLLFFPGITTVAFTETPEERAKLAEIPSKYGWAAGVGIAQIAPYNSAGYLDSNRREILLCLIAAVSSAVFVPASSDVNAQPRNRWLEELVTRRRSSTSLLFYSLLNVVLRYDPVGWGVPYNHSLSYDVPEQLMNASIQLLNLILEHRSAESNVAAPQPSVVATAATYFSSSNLFAVALSELSTPQEFELIFKAIIRLLTNHVTATNTYLPGAVKQISCHQEVLAFFWQVIQINRKFLDFILRRDDFTDVLFPIFHLIHEGRKDPAQLALVHLGIFVLLFLSGNYADYLLLVFIKIFIDGHKSLEQLWECMLTVVANVSPYIKSLSLVTSMRLLKLFGSLSRKNFLLQRERNHRYVFFLLEAFNNLIQYQYEGNTYLVYAVISQRTFFFKLLDLAKNPASALAEATASGAEPSADASQVSQDQSIPASNDTKPVADGAAKIEHTEANPVDHAGSSLEAKFVPTMEWLGTWVPRLPLGTIIRFLNGILPTIDQMVDGTASDQDKIVEYLRKTTLVGILPVPHPILIRHYSPNKQTQAWFNQYLWGVTYMRNTTDVQLFKDTTPQLFLFKTPSRNN